MKGKVILSAITAAAILVSLTACVKSLDISAAETYTAVSDTTIFTAKAEAADTNPIIPNYERALKATPNN